MLAAAAAPRARSRASHIYNLGTDETIVVDDSVALITEHLGVSPEIEHTGGERGWIGDSPLIHLDCDAHPRARLGADAVDPRGDRAHAGLARRRTRTPWREKVAVGATR